MSIPVLSSSPKQRVYVPEYPGQEVFEKYRGIPEGEYLPRCKAALEDAPRIWVYSEETSNEFNLIFA